MHFETVTHTIPADRLHHGDILDGERIERIRKMDTPRGPRVGLKSTSGALRVLDAGDMVTVTSEIVVGDPVGSESGTMRLDSLAFLATAALALVPVSLVAVFVARLAGAVAGAV